MPNKLEVTIAGVLCLFLAVCWLVWIAMNVWANDVFGVTYLDLTGSLIPEKIAAITCPAEWAENKPGTVNVTVQNPENHPATYRLKLASSTPRNDPKWEPGPSVIVPAGQSATVSWVVDPHGVSDTNLFALVDATSDTDSQNSRRYRFTGRCSMRLLYSPEASGPRLRSLAAVLGILIGGVLIYMPNRPLGRRGKRDAIIIGLLILVVVAIALYTILAPVHPMSF